METRAETTMDDTQRPLKVQIEDAVVVDHIFNALMGGGDLEPGRNFIETNAFVVRNIDV